MEVACEGWLTKSPPLKNIDSGSMKKWKRRWCVLDTQQHTLAYFTGQDCKNRKGVVDLQRVTHVNPSVPSKLHSFTFSVVLPERVFYFSAECDDDRCRWAKVLHDHCPNQDKRESSVDCKAQRETSFLSKSFSHITDGGSSTNSNSGIVRSPTVTAVMPTEGPPVSLPFGSPSSSPSASAPPAPWSSFASEPAGSAGLSRAGELPLALEPAVVTDKTQDHPLFLVNTDTGRHNIHVVYPYLKLQDCVTGEVQRSWALSHLRAYGQTNEGVFELQAGRRNPEGPGIFFFEVLDGRNIAAHLDQLITKRSEPTSKALLSQPTEVGLPIRELTYVQVTTTTSLEPTMPTITNLTQTPGGSHCAYSVVDISKTQALGKAMGQQLRSSDSVDGCTRLTRHSLSSETRDIAEVSLTTPAAGDLASRPHLRNVLDDVNDLLSSLEEETQETMTFEKTGPIVAPVSELQACKTHAYVNMQVGTGLDHPEMGRQVSNDSKLFLPTELASLLPFLPQQGGSRTYVNLQNLGHLLPEGSTTGSVGMQISPDSGHRSVAVPPAGHPHYVNLAMCDNFLPSK